MLWNDSVDICEDIEPLNEEGFCNTGALGAVKAPWEYNSQLNYNEDWDNDGIPNYADHYFGPGAYQPVTFGAVNNEDGYTHENISCVGQEGYIESEADFANVHLIPDQRFIGDIDSGDYWHPQMNNSSCAIVAQKSIAESFGFPDIPEQELVKLAEENGLYDPNIGTMPENVGKLLEFVYNIPVERSYNNSLDDLAKHLQNGEKVIVGINANEVWDPIYDADGVPMQQNMAGHAVVLTGISQDLSSGEVKVVISDSGIPDGMNKVLRLDDFMNAWEDYGKFAAVTKTQEGV